MCQLLGRRASSWPRAQLPSVDAVSCLLHPVGPEPVQTYWARRALVFGAAAVLDVAAALIIHGTSSGSKTMAARRGLVRI
jgi:hypothetical protein